METKIWLAFIDDNGEKVTGIFDKVSENSNLIKIRSKQNTISLPWHRVLKIKENEDITIQSKGGRK